MLHPKRLTTCSLNTSLRLSSLKLLFRQSCWNYDRSGEDDSGFSKDAKMCLHLPRPLDYTR
jgi:hypothetical protein